MTRVIPGVQPDRAAHRAWLVSLTDMPSGGSAVDLGCGRGEDILLLADRHPFAGRIIGIDSSETSIAIAAEAARALPQVSFKHAALDSRLPLDGQSIDLLYSHNLLECLADPDDFAKEVARVVRPGGQVVIAHWDWDSQVFDGAEKSRVRRLVHAYADWQQTWMAYADGWMGRRLWGAFNATSRFVGGIHARVLTNTIFEPSWFGYENAQAFRSLVKRGLASGEDYEAFTVEQAELNARGRYFYSITAYAYVGHRVAD